MLRAIRCIASQATINVAMLIAATLLAKADVRIDRPDSYSIEIYVTGTIKPDDANQLERMQHEISTHSLRVYLDSKGGDVVAAIAIGKRIRISDGWTYVGWFDGSNLAFPEAANCFSSCALILSQVSIVRITVRLDCIDHIWPRLPWIGINSKSESRRCIR